MFGVYSLLLFLKGKGLVIIFQQISDGKIASVFPDKQLVKEVNLMTFLPQVYQHFK